MCQIVWCYIWGLPSFLYRTSIPVAVFFFSQIKCGHCSFQNVNNTLSNTFVFNRSCCIRNLECLFIHMATHDLFCVTRNSNIGIMCYDNNLPFLFGCTNARHQFSIYGLIIQIIFWLINDNRRIVFTQCQIEYKQNNATFTGRQLFKRTATHFNLNETPT